jgi:hypothetical protein
MSQEMAPILSADDLLAVADFEWHEVTIMGKRTRQRALEIGEWLQVRKRCPDIDKLFDGTVDTAIDGITDDLSGVFDLLNDRLLGMSKSTAAYVVACSIGKGDDDKAIKAIIGKPDRFVVEGLRNVLKISFSEGGIAGFFTRQFGDLIATAQETGFTPAGFVTLFVQIMEAATQASQAAADLSVSPGSQATTPTAPGSTVSS